MKIFYIITLFSLDAMPWKLKKDKSHFFVYGFYIFLISATIYFGLYLDSQYYFSCFLDQILLRKFCIKFNLLKNIQKQKCLIKKISKLR